MPAEPTSSENPDNLEHALGGPYASRGGLKLAHALRAFHLDPTGLTCADLGCSTGGFTDCLLKHGAARVFAVDTAYGELAWKLRQDPRVTVMERTNALHAAPPPPPIEIGLVTLDVSWTPARKAAEAGLKWLVPGGKLVALVKPHYEAKAFGVALPRGGVLPDVDAEKVAGLVREELMKLPGARLIGWERSPIRGGKAGSKPRPAASTAGGGGGGGNLEWLALLERA